MSRTEQKKTVVKIVLLVICCVAFLTNISHAVTPQETQKIQDAAPSKIPGYIAGPRKILVFNLCGGFKHSSIPYAAEAIEAIGKKTNAFEVDQSDDMAVFNPETLAKYDAVVFNSTTKLDFSDPAKRKSLMDFVKGGKGIVGIHAATDNFYDWPEAAEMMGATFAGHPWTSKGTWAVKIDDARSPIVKTFDPKGFKINDEIYKVKQINLRDNARVLLSLDFSDAATTKADPKKTTDVPIAWVRAFGQGRVFYTSLGHNHDVFWNSAVLGHLLAGIQFAAGDLPADTTASEFNIKTFNAMLAEAATYEYGKSRQTLTRLNDFIRNSLGNDEQLKMLEKRLLKFLQDDTTLAGKLFACKELSIIGTEDSVPVLATLLAEPTTSDMARYALERIPGTAVDQVLLQALSETAGTQKVGIINTLARRGAEKMVSAVEKLIYSSDQTEAAAAIAALGQIASPQASEALAKAKDKVGGKLRLLVLDAYLSCADQLAAAGDKKGARAIYEKLFAANEPVSIRTAALRGRVSVAGKKAADIIVDAIESGDEEMQVEAIALAREIPGTRTTKSLAKSLKKLAPAAQMQLLSALGDRGDSVALSAVVKVTKSEDSSVRVAALNAIGQLGDSSSVMLLAKRAAATKGAERQAGRESLYRLRGKKVDKTIISKVSSADPKVKVELIKSMGKRYVSESSATLFKTAKDSDRKVRLESIKVLADVAGKDDIDPLIELLLNVNDGAERTAVEKTAASIIRSDVVDTDAAVDSILAALDSAKNVQARKSILVVLGKAGNNKALGVLRKGLKDSEPEIQLAAIRALSEWPSPEPIEDLLQIVKTTDNNTYRVLTLRGYVRLVALDANRTAEQKVAIYRDTLSTAKQISEKKMILSELANVQSILALNMAAEYLKDGELSQEAAAAIVKIAGTTRRTDPKPTKQMLQKIIDQVELGKTIRGQAKKVLRSIK